MNTSYVAITETMLEPVVDSIVANIGVILPIAVVLFGIMIGIGLVPKILSKFTNV